MGTGERDDLIISMRERGATLEEIGQAMGVSRERVRQILKKRGAPARSTSDTFRLRREQHLLKRDEILRRFRETFDAEQVSEELAVPVSIVRDVTAGIARSLHMQHRKPYPRRWSDDELIGFLQEASQAVGGVLTCGDYNDYARSRSTRKKPWPTHQTIFKRFGSWREALSRAGLRSNPASAITGKYLFEDSHCVDALRDAARELETAPTVQQYEEFARSSNGGVPSSATIRNRFGSWIDALRAAGLL